MFEIERVRDRERKINYSPHKGTDALVRHRERLEIEGVRDRESQLYLLKDYIAAKLFLTIFVVRNLSTFIVNFDFTNHILK